VSVLVTGGSGVVGRAVVTHLVEAGRPARALARSDEAQAVVASLGATPVVGDILDYPSLLRAMHGTDIVYHVAGVNDMCLRDPAPMYRANVDGTRNVVRAAVAAGVSRVVHTSSAVTLGEGHGMVGTERTQHRGSFLSHYERSKYLAEQVAFAESGRVDVVAVNPSSVQGPGRATGTGRLLLDLLNGRLPVMIEARLSIVDIDDCAAGHLLAAERGVSGERYVLSGFMTTTRRAVLLLEEIVGRRLRTRFLPGSLVAGAASVVGPVSRLLRRAYPVCAESIRVMRFGHTYDGSRATRDLGLEYRSAEDTIRRTVEWFAAEGLLEGAIDPA
jgi:dihydroflavonol-4-reductase